MSDNEHCLPVIFTLPYMFSIIKTCLRRAPQTDMTYMLKLAMRILLGHREINMYLKASLFMKHEHKSKYATILFIFIFLRNELSKQI